MPEKRRRHIAAVVERHHLTVLEDDVYGFLSPERTPLASLAPERTLFLTSVSKSLFPGIRLGAVAAPAAFVEKLSAAVHATMIMVSPIAGDLFCGWMEDGTAARISDWKCHEIAARHTIARRLLAGVRLQTHPASTHIWLHLPPRWSSDGFAAELRARGVLLNASREFAVSDQHPGAVRICLGTPRTRAGLEQALMKVVELFHERAPAARIVV
jgi:DNA-binding transcriptional MocR family regulator